MAFFPMADAVIAVLASEIKAQVPASGGVCGAEGGVVVKHADQPFTTAELATIQAIVNVHDATAIRQAKVARKALKASEKAKDPTKLTDKERLTRLELLANAD